MAFLCLGEEEGNEDASMRLVRREGGAWARELDEG
jgi:hypothetical protein